MKNQREQASTFFKQGVNMAIHKGNQSGFIAAIRFTFLADMMQIQCLYFENTDLLKFTLPVCLHSTVIDLAAHNNAKISTHEADSEKSFILEFEMADDQDKFIQIFELMSFRGMRAYPTPDLFLGKSVIDKDLCQEIVDFLHGVAQDQYEGGWNRIR